MKEKFKKNFPIIIFVFLIFLGLAIMCYPLTANFLATKHQKKVVTSYQKLIENNNTDKITSMIDDAKKYNEELTQSTITDVFTNPQKNASKEYLNILSTGKDGVMGYITIPKIGEEIPIYHGTSTKTLQKGVGHLEGSSFPIGGENTNAILSAHRGLPSAKLFTDLDQLEEGDKFYIHILGETLAYQVENISIIRPFEIEKLSLKEGGDYVTLVTCHPYAINTHRILVRGVRTTYHGEKETHITSPIKTGIPTKIFRVGICIAIAIIFVVIIFLIKTTSSAQEEKEDELEIIV